MARCGGDVRLMVNGAFLPSDVGWFWRGCAIQGLRVVGFTVLKSVFLSLIRAEFRLPGFVHSSLSS